jgi:hypothetical protein
VVSLQGRADRPVADPVEIDFAHRIETGVKGGIDFAELADGDIHRQEAIYPHEEISLAEAGGGPEMGDLMEGMHPGIRPAGAYDPDLLAGHPADALLDNLLDGDAVDLALPAAIGAAVILDDQSDIPHHRLASDQT